VSAVIDAHGLGKRYGRKWALTDCTLVIPSGHVVGLVGPNGAGKSTLLNLAVGLLSPTTGTIEVLGDRPAGSPEELGRVGFVAQDTPTYSGLSVADHLQLGAHLNPTWDRAMAESRIDQLGLDPHQKAGKLSGGQRAQLALTLAVAKRPELLILDEPVASLDPLARREFLQILMETVAEDGVSVGSPRTWSPTSSGSVTTWSCSWARACRSQARSTSCSPNITDSSANGGTLPPSRRTRR
jgi:ABC-2 type transport system ATP-binding protein